MAPPSLIDFIISRRYADGVVVAGCAESACYQRLGIRWTKERFAGQRDPYLRARVPRDRLATIWTSALESRRFEKELAAFKSLVGALGPMQRKTRTSAGSSPASGRPPSIKEKAES
jgi:coenzyme F420-reducing hydrogenase delta subunit